MKWDRIDGIVQAFDLVGLGDGQVGGGAPWATTRGSAKVNLETGRIKFKVKGLVLTVGSVPDSPFSGLPIGTTAGVTDIRGILVCDVNGVELHARLIHFREHLHRIVDPPFLAYCLSFEPD